MSLLIHMCKWKYFLACSDEIKGGIANGPGDKKGNGHKSLGQQWQPVSYKGAGEDYTDGVHHASLTVCDIHAAWPKVKTCMEAVKVRPGRLRWLLSSTLQLYILVP